MPCHSTGFDFNEPLSIKHLLQTSNRRHTQLSERSVVRQFNEAEIDSMKSK